MPENVRDKTIDFDIVANLYDTRSRLPVTVVYQEEQPSQRMALKRELAIKSLCRKAKEALIESVR